MSRRLGLSPNSHHKTSQMRRRGLDDLPTEWLKFDGQLL